MKYKVLNDFEFIKEYLSISESDLSRELGKPRSTFNYWKHNEESVSAASLASLYEYAYKNEIYLNKIKEQIYKDLENNKTKILFHGAKKKIDTKLNISYSKSNNDFGKGFYLGESLYQSATFVANYPSSNIYICKYNSNTKLNVVNFDIDEEWMLAIAYYRNRIPDYINNKKISNIIKKVDNADVIIAPIADNNMYLVIENFIDGIITDKQCLSALSATNLGKQYVFKTNKALESLLILEQCYLCSSEKLDYLKEKETNDKIGAQKTKMAQRKFAGKGKYIEELLK